MTTGKDMGRATSFVNLITFELVLMLYLWSKKCGPSDGCLQKLQSLSCLLQHLMLYFEIANSYLEAFSPHATVKESDSELP